MKETIRAKMKEVASKVEFKMISIILVSLLYNSRRGLDSRSDLDLITQYRLKNLPPCSLPPSATCDTTVFADSKVTRQHVFKTAQPNSLAIGTIW